MTVAQASLSRRVQRSILPISTYKGAYQIQFAWQPYEVINLISTLSYYVRYGRTVSHLERNALGHPS